MDSAVEWICCQFNKMPKDLQPVVVNRCKRHWRDMAVAVFECKIPLANLEKYRLVPSREFVVSGKTCRLFVSYEQDHVPETCRFVVNVQCQAEHRKDFPIEQCLVDMLDRDLSPGLDFLPNVRVKFANATVVYTAEIELPARRLGAVVAGGSVCFQIDLASRPSILFIEKNPGVENREIPYTTMHREQTILRAVASYDQLAFLETQFFNVTRMRSRILRSRQEHDNIRNLLKREVPEPPGENLAPLEENVLPPEEILAPLEENVVPPPENHSFLANCLVYLIANIFLIIPFNITVWVMEKWRFIKMFISDISEEAHLVIRRRLHTLFSSFSTVFDQNS